MMKREWTVYVVQAANGTLYTGITKDVARRLKQHREGKGGARFFRSSAPKELLVAISGFTQSMALRVEYRIKQMSRAEKLRLIPVASSKKFRELIK
jgi:putative endonuclease